MKKKKSKLSDLLGLPEKKEDWEEHWQGMPEFSQEDKTAFKSIYIHFRSLEDMRGFEKLIKQKITLKTRFIWYPKADIDRLIDKRYVDES